jgi:hypothetical protein
MINSDLDHHSPSLLDERCHHGTAELAAAASHGHCSIHLRLLRFAAVARVFSHIVGAGQKPAG